MGAIIVDDSDTEDGANIVHDSDSEDGAEKRATGRKNDRPEKHATGSKNGRPEKHATGSNDGDAEKYASQYPQTPEDMKASCPELYATAYPLAETDEGEKPLPSRISEGSLEQLRISMPARNTHSRLMLQNKYAICRDSPPRSRQLTDIMGNALERAFFI